MAFKDGKVTCVYGGASYGVLIEQPGVDRFAYIDLCYRR